MNKAASDIMKRHSSEHRITDEELAVMFEYAKDVANGAARMFDTATDYIIGLDKYLRSIDGVFLSKPVMTKDGEATINHEKPTIFVSYLKYIGHTPKRWEEAKKKSEAHLTVLEDIELFFAADGTEKALVGVYEKDVAMKVLPIVINKEEEKNKPVELNVTINGSKVELG